MLKYTTKVFGVCGGGIYIASTKFIPLWWKSAINFGCVYHVTPPTLAGLRRTSPVLKISSWFW